MKADLTRLTFDQAKHYRAVQQQQGRVQLDSDWNEQLDITAHRVETETVDVVGTCGAPMHADGFHLVANAAGLSADEAARPGNQPLPAIGAGDLAITAGRFYAGGVLAENDRIALVSAQPDLPSVEELTKLGSDPLFPLQTPGTYLAYLDVWPRLRTAIDDPHIREVALGGPDTATRTKNAWQVKFLPAPVDANCSTPIPEWDSLNNLNPGTVAASVKKTPDKTGPCIVDPGSGYRRLENQLYRLEVHIGGDSLGQTSFKWSRDNGSIVTRWLDQSALGEISVESSGRDKVLNLAATNWVELTDDAHEELGLPGVFANISSVNGNVLTLGTPTAEMDFAKFPRNPKVRRWESAPAALGKWITPDGSSVNLNTTDTFELEDGVVVEFGGGSFRTGDYWLIPARTALPHVDWPTTGPANDPVPVPQPPHGITHHYCKLAIVKWEAGVFTISDCRSLFPPLTEHTNLFYVSGESQEATPNPTLPAATLLPLALPLKVGIANGEWPVAGARVRFTVNVGTGTLTVAGGIAITDADGMASCGWAVDSATPNPEVIAELLDSGDQRVGVPVIFHARLNTAKLVSYDPANCQGMSNGNPPVVTVQDALDFLCHEKAGVDCCVTVGKLGDRPGDYETVAEALQDLLDKRGATAICLSLLPGDHLYDRKDPIISKDQKNPLHFQINGCSHASRLVLKTPMMFQRIAAVVLRDISILMDGGEIEVTSSAEVEISHCIIKGRSEKGAPLLQFAVVQHFIADGNQILALADAKTFTPANVFRGVAGLERMYELADERDFAKAAEETATRLVALPAAERASLAETLTVAVKNPELKLSTAEKQTYTAMIKTLGTARPTAKTLAARLTAIRVGSAPAAVNADGTTAGTAIALMDFSAIATFTSNRIAGVVSFGGVPVTQPLTMDELKKLGAELKAGAVVLTADGGHLHLRGNELLQIAGGEALLQALREEKGNVKVWTTAHLTDNNIALDQNLFVANHVSLNNTKFLTTSFNGPVGTAVAHTGIYIGNCANDLDQNLVSITANGEQSVANHNLNIAVM